MCVYMLHLHLTVWPGIWSLVALLQRKHATASPLLLLQIFIDFDVAVIKCQLALTKTKQTQQKRVQCENSKGKYAAQKRKESKEMSAQVVGLQLPHATAARMFSTISQRKIVRLVA